MDDQIEQKHKLVGTASGGGGGGSPVHFRKNFNNKVDESPMDKQEYEINKKLLEEIRGGIKVIEMEKPGVAS